MFLEKSPALVSQHSHYQVLIDGTSDKESEVPRHSAPLSNLQLTHLKIDKLPRGIGHGPLSEKWKKAEITKKWQESPFAQKREKGSKRRALNDFERFKAMRLQKQRRFEQRKALKKIKASA
jgi:large subunit ribosomal protein L14e